MKSNLYQELADRRAMRRETTATRRLLAVLVLLGLVLTVVAIIYQLPIGDAIGA